MVMPPATAPLPIRAGEFEARLATSQAEIDAAQSLRYRVFFEEMCAHPSAEDRESRRDVDDFDRVCDHLLIIDHARSDRPAGVVATYRLLRRDCAARAGGFYTAGD